MSFPTPTAHFDARFSAPLAAATPWDEAVAALSEAELYWLTTVRADGRPHVTPLVGLWRDGAPHFCTGPDEQKARNLTANPSVALTTGTNAWQDGLDVVVEGTALAVHHEPTLRAIADDYVTKYDGAWRFGVENGAFTNAEGGTATVYRIEPRKVLAFAKRPHGQTTFRFDG